MKKALRSLLFIAGLWICGQTQIAAQEELNKYEIAEVEVRGAQTSDPEALKVVAGLTVGKTIIIPDDIQTAMHNLYSLRLFTDVRIIQTKTIGESIFLEIQVLEKPKMSRYNLIGIRSGQKETIEKIVDPYLTKGAIVTEVTKSNAKNALLDHYHKKGYLDATVDITEKVDTLIKSGLMLDVTVDRGSKVRIKDINFAGNDHVKSGKLRRKMKETKEQRALFKASKFIEKDYDADKDAVIAYYNTIGFRDARITRDSIYRNPEGKLEIDLDISEGRQYFFRDIAWRGNTLYSADQLTKVLDIKKGDIFNEELLNQRLTFSMDGNDVSALYMDDGYLFFSARPVETAIVGDSIDIEVRIFEGPQATINRVEVLGNDRTHEHVIRRELVTRPGKKFSRSDIIRSQRKVVALGYFDQEKLDISTPVDQNNGTVDIVYKVDEVSSDQLELSAGYQPPSAFYANSGGLIGTFGLSFNNFSLRNITNGKAWDPLPQGDGQKLSLRAQTSGKRFQSYNFSFTEPWLGGKKPNSFTLAAFTTKNSSVYNSEQFLRISQVTVGLASQLKWPDENFIFGYNLNYQQIKLSQFSGLFYDPNRFDYISNGSFNNVYLSINFARNTIFEPIYPTQGSIISLTADLTPPYSLFNDSRDYADLTSQEHYKWVEYHKWKIKAEWYKQFVGKFVFHASAKMGFLGTYSSRYGASPFERYEFGAEPLQNQTTITGLDPIRMRGYESDDFASVTPEGNRIGSSYFNKYSLELRYPFSTNPSSTIYAMTFVEAGNAWNNVQDINPFELRRSVGAGLRVFLPMFGLLGFDYSIGFDKPELIAQGANWTKYGQFKVLLGFEPE